MINKKNNLGRDKLPVPWSEERWKLIDKTVHDESKRIKVAEKVFPVQPDPGAVSVPDDIIIEEGRLTAAEGAELPYVEISREFNLTDSQCEQEAELGTAVMLSRFAATAVALAADEIVFKGTNANLPQGVTVHRQGSANTGLLGLAREEGRCLEFAVSPIIQLGSERVQVDDENPNGECPRVYLFSEEENAQGRGQGLYGEAIFNALSHGIQKLWSEGKPPPYLFLLPPHAFAETYQTMPGTFTFAAERIGPLAEGGFHQVPALPPDTGFLVSLPSDPVRVAVSQPTITEYRQPSPTIEGEQKFRVVSRVQYVVRDTKALLKFDFVKDGSADGSGTARAAGIRFARRAAAAEEPSGRLEDRLKAMESNIGNLLVWAEKNGARPVPQGAPRESEENISPENEEEVPPETPRMGETPPTDEPATRETPVDEEQPEKRSATSSTEEPAPEVSLSREEQPQRSEEERPST